MRIPGTWQALKNVHWLFVEGKREEQLIFRNQRYQGPEPGMAEEWPVMMDYQAFKVPEVEELLAVGPWTFIFSELYFVVSNNTCLTGLLGKLNEIIQVQV